MLANPMPHIRVVKSDYILYKKIAKIYICLALLGCFVYLPTAYDHIVNPQWSDLYEEAHEVKETNIFIKLSNLFFHIRYLGLILFFYFLAFGNNIKFQILLGISAVLPMVLVTICNASRGGLVALVMSILMVYILFAQYLSKSIKRYIKISILILSPIGIAYIAAVTLARFDPSVSYVSAEDSVFYYLGHSMLMFDYGVVDTIKMYWNGGYMFGLGNLRPNGTHYGTDFFTIIGAFYQDFGPILTVLIVFVISSYFFKIFKKRSVGIPELYIMLTYAMLIFNGVFVVGYGFGIQLLEAILVYYLLKIIQNNKSYARNNCLLSSSVSPNQA